MANQLNRPMEGERYVAKYPRDYPAAPSGLLPLPYYPNLKIALRSVTSSLVLTYLEIYHPAPQDSSGASLRVPVTIHLDQVSQDMQITRRTLFTALCVLAARWGSEEARSRAARAGREFLNPAHSLNGQWKYYSITGSIGYIPHTVVQLRRNLPLIVSMLQKVGITAIAQEEFVGIDRFDKLTDVSVSAQTPPFRVERESLSDIMLRASVLSGDRRAERYPRLRAAIERGLVGPEALKLHSSTSR